MFHFTRVETSPAANFVRALLHRSGRVFFHNGRQYQAYDGCKEGRSEQADDNLQKWIVHYFHISQSGVNLILAHPLCFILVGHAAHDAIGHFRVDNGGIQHVKQAADKPCDDEGDQRNDKSTSEGNVPSQVGGMLAYGQDAHQDANADQNDKAENTDHNGVATTFHGGARIGQAGHLGDQSPNDKDQSAY